MHKKTVTYSHAHLHPMPSFITLNRLAPLSPPTPPSNQFPHTQNPKLTRICRLILPSIIPQPPRILTTKLRHRINRNLLPRRTQLQPLNIKPPHASIRVERQVFRIAPIAARNTEKHNVRLALAVSQVIPVRAESRELEAQDWWCVGVVHFELELGGGDAAFGDAVIGAAAAHYLDAAAHVVAHEFFVCHDAAVVAELMRVVGWEVLHGEVVVGLCELCRVEFADVAETC